MFWQQKRSAINPAQSDWFLCTLGQFELNLKKRLQSSWNFTFLQFHTMIAAAARLAGSLGRPGGVPCNPKVLALMDECLFGRLFASRYRKPRGSRIWGGFKPSWWRHAGRLGETRFSLMIARSFTARGAHQRSRFTFAREDQGIARWVVLL